MNIPVKAKPPEGILDQISWTRQCGGDLGLVLNNEVVAILFVSDLDNTQFRVYNIRKGGSPSLKTNSFLDALDHMEQIAQQIIDDTRAVDATTL